MRGGLLPIQSLGHIPHRGCHKSTASPNRPTRSRCAALFAAFQRARGGRCPAASRPGSIHASGQKGEVNRARPACSMHGPACICPTPATPCSCVSSAVLLTHTAVSSHASDCILRLPCLHAPRPRSSPKPCSSRNAAAHPPASRPPPPAPGKPPHGTLRRPLNVQRNATASRPSCLALGS